jgi:hypothetical protein
VAIVVCPNCGYKQEAGDKCRKCSSLFAYHQQSEARPPEPDWKAETSDSGESSPGIFRRVYRVARWATLAVLVLVIILILRKSPPPQVAVDPEAPARVESKMSALEAATAAGQPYQLRLDEAEVNSFLGSNLALKREEEPAGKPPSSAAPAAEPAFEEVQSSVRDVRVSLVEDRVEAYVVFDFHGKDLSLVLEGRLHVQDGYVRFDPTSGKLGSLPLPQSTLERAVNRLMSSPENKEKLRVPAEISDLRVENGELVVAYR